jgi:hypothetical protein
LFCSTAERTKEKPMTLDELDQKLPNGFHDAQIFSIEIDYAAGAAKFSLGLLVGWPEDPEPERERYQKAELFLTGQCFCSIDPPFPTYSFIPDGRPIYVSGDPAQPDHLPALRELSAKFPPGTWCYRFFVHDWNGFIQIAARDARVTWVGEVPKHARELA